MRWTLRSMIVVVVLISLAAALGVPYALRAMIESNERAAVAALRSVAKAEEAFRAGDLDRNGVNDYWTGDVAGLYCLSDRKTGKPIGSVDLELASADVFRIDDGGATFSTAAVVYDPGLVGHRSTNSGFWTQALLAARIDEEYAQDTDGSGAQVHHLDAFGFVSVPSKWDTTGNHTYIVNEDGVVFRRDFGMETTQPTIGTRIDAFPDGHPLHYNNWEYYLSSMWGRTD